MVCKGTSRGQFIKHRCAQCTHYHDRWLIHNMLWIFEIYDSVCNSNCQQASANHPKTQNHYAISFDPSSRKIMENQKHYDSIYDVVFFWEFHKLLQGHIWLDFMTNISYPFIFPDWVWITKSTIFGMMNTARQELGIPVHVLDIAWEPKCNKCWPGWG